METQRRAFFNTQTTKLKSIFQVNISLIFYESFTPKFQIAFLANTDGFGV
jgi:hypothetical protein